MTPRSIASYVIWASLFALSIAIASFVAFRIGNAHGRDEYRFAERLDRESACLALAKPTYTSTKPPHGYPSAGYYRVMQMFLSEQDCLKVNSFSFLSYDDVYDVSGVEVHLELPGPGETVWRTAGKPHARKGCHMSGIRPSTWTRQLRSE